jgi:hypothetical protein
MKNSTGRSHPALRRTQFIILLLAVGLLTGRSVELWAADCPLLRANYSGVSGAFAPVWTASERELFTKYGLNVDLRYIAPATSTQLYK